MYIEKGNDYSTLLTCTPYGINDHRLCVRGVRAEIKSTNNETVRKKQSRWLLEYKKALGIGITLIVIIIMFLTIKRILDKRKDRKADK